MPRHRREYLLCNAACTDDTAASDGHTGQDRDIAAEPDVVTQRDWLGAFQALVALLGKHWMNGGIHAAVRTDKAVRTDGNRRAVHEIGTMVEK